jgi:hypothetical protein
MLAMAASIIKKYGFFLVAMLIIASGIVVLLITRSNKQHHEQEIIEYIGSTLPQLSTWKARAFRQHFNPAIWKGIDRQARQQTLRRYARLGPLLSYDRPQFSNRLKQAGATEISRAVLLRSYIIRSHYKYDDALIHLTLSGQQQKYRIEKITLIAKIFDAEKTDRIEVQLPPKRKNAKKRNKKTD